MNKTIGGQAEKADRPERENDRRAQKENEQPFVRHQSAGGGEGGKREEIGTV